MSFDWNLYISLAAKLIAEAGKFAERESCLRAAISRAYYGAFGLAARVAHREGLLLKGEAKDHKKLSRYFSEAPSPVRKRIGTELARLRKDRNLADYKGRIRRNLYRQALFSLERARQIAQALQKLHKFG